MKDRNSLWRSHMIGFHHQRVFIICVMLKRSSDSKTKKSTESTKKRFWRNDRESTRSMWPNIIKTSRARAPLSSRTLPVPKSSRLNVLAWKKEWNHPEVQRQLSQQNQGNHKNQRSENLKNQGLCKTRIKFKKWTGLYSSFRSKKHVVCGQATGNMRSRRTGWTQLRNLNRCWQRQKWSKTRRLDTNCGIKSKFSSHICSFRLSSRLLRAVST